MKNFKNLKLILLFLMITLFMGFRLSATVNRSEKVDGFEAFGFSGTSTPTFFTANTNTYYISTAANGGSDSNDGSAGSPWLTLAYACAHATTPGDTIHVNSGTYIETTYCSVAVGVSIVGSDRTTTIIKSHYYVPRTGGNVSWGAITFKSSLEGTNGNQSISNLTIDGDNLQGGIAILVLRRSNVIIHDCTIKDFYIGGILLHGGENMYTQPSTYNSGNQIYNCTIRNCSAVDNHDDHNFNKAASIEFSGESNLLIHDNECLLTDKPSGENGDNIDGNWYNKNVKLYHNTLTMQEYEKNAWSFQMVMFNNQGGIEIYDNTYKGGDCKIDIAGNFHYKGDYDYSYFIHDNYCSSNPVVKTSNQWGVIMEDQNISDVIITRNHFYNLAHVFEINSTNNIASSFNRISISYNILENCGWHMDQTWLALIQITNSSNVTFSDISFYNNIILGDQISVTSAISVYPLGTIKNLSFKNNIIEHNFNGTWLDVQNKGSINGLDVENNILYDNANNNNPTFSGNPVTNYTFLNNIKSDPLFVSKTDFHLQSNSPAVKAGVDVGLLFDFDNHSVSNPPEIGVYEIDGSTSGVSTIENVDGDFYIYPNPVKDKITISAKDGKVKEMYMKLYDIKGKELYSLIKMGDCKLDVSKFKPGIYFLKIIFESKIEFKKFIKS